MSVPPAAPRILDEEALFASARRRRTAQRLFDAGLSEATLRTILPETWTRQAFGEFSSPHPMLGRRP